MRVRAMDFTHWRICGDKGRIQRKLTGISRPMQILRPLPGEKNQTRNLLILRHLRRNKTRPMDIAIERVIR